MGFLLNAVSNVVESIAGGASTFCIFLFFEPEVPVSLREE